MRRLEGGFISEYDYNIGVRVVEILCDGDVEAGSLVDEDWLLEVYGLRGFDPIHLASALWLKEKTDTPLHFAVFDQRLRVAAECAGLAVAP